MGIANRARHKKRKLGKKRNGPGAAETNSQCTHPFLGVCKDCGKTYCRVCGMYVTKKEVRDASDDL